MSNIIPVLIVAGIISLFAFSIYLSFVVCNPYGQGYEVLPWWCRIIK